MGPLLKKAKHTSKLAMLQHAGDSWKSSFMDLVYQNVAKYDAASRQGTSYF